MKKRISIIVCLMFSFAFIVIGIMISNGHFQHKDEYIFNQSSDIKRYIIETMSCDDVEYLSTYEDDSILIVVAKTNDDQHIFNVFEQLNNGRYKEIYQYYRSFDMAYLLNSTAVFCIDRSEYFDMLKKADEGTNSGKLIWCEYVLNGINQEMSKVSNLMNKTFFSEKIVKPAINRAYDLHFISQEYKQVLLLSLNKENALIKSADVQSLLKDKTPRQITTLITKMVEIGLLIKPEINSRMYMINLLSKDLLRGIIESLHKEQFISIEN